MAETERIYAGLDVTWPDASGRDDDPLADQVLAETDEFHPTAAQSTQDGLRLFFATADAREAAAAHLRTALPVCGVASVDVPDEHWAERSQASLTAVRVGALTIAPPWDVPVDRAGVIIIQPSMGFGTGHHASTRLCLRLLQEVPLSGAAVLDVGTGSGVLAIAARQLGAASVTGIDYDADAVASARECAALNGAESAIDFRQVDLEREPAVAGAPFAVLLANLTGGMLVRVASQLCGLLTPGGTIIVSGVTLAEEPDVVDAFLGCGAHFRARLAEDEWVGLRFT